MLLTQNTSIKIRQDKLRAGLIVDKLRKISEKAISEKAIRLIVVIM